jgi:hypothetical protein
MVGIRHTMTTSEVLAIVLTFAKVGAPVGGTQASVEKVRSAGRQQYGGDG